MSDIRHLGMDGCQDYGQLVMELGITVWCFGQLGMEERITLWWVLRFRTAGEGGRDQH